jgi:SAM-dependent methyltransferase
VHYWDSRADSYSSGVIGELADERGLAWGAVISNRAGAALSRASGEGRRACVLDLGCGPGFFETLFLGLGCQVDAVDASPEMLARAQENIASLPGADAARFHQADVTRLPFPDDTFDLAIARNLTWLLLEPENAYAEWLRVLRPGGKLLVFDANWYRYLFDDDIDTRRRADQAANRLEGWDDDAQSDAAQELEFEKTAARLPLSPVLRPQWDTDVLMRLGAAHATADEGIWREIWTENERAYYGSSPMFLVEGIK